MQQMGFDSVHIVRPPNLIRAQAKRMGETLMVHLLQTLNAVGIAKRLAPMHTAAVAVCMRNVAADSAQGIKIITGQEILAHTGE